MKSEKYLLLILYILGVLFCIPIFRYIIFFVIAINPNASDEYVFTRVYFSSPMLIATGALMFLLFKRFHRITGLIFFLIGFIWFLEIIKTILRGV
jgi:hypothetical protein